MKENAIHKINQMGKVSLIIIRILFVITCIVAALLLAVAIFLTAIPDDFLKIGVKGDAWMELNPSSKPGWGFGWDVVDLDQLQEDLDREEVMFDVDAGAASIRMTDVEATEDGLRFTGSGALADGSLHQMAGDVWLGIIDAVFAMVVLLFAASLCKAFWHCRTPFEDNVIKRMRYLAFSLIPWGLTTTNYGQTFGGAHLYLNVDLEAVFAILIIFGLTFVFKYGAMLQQESDETL